MLREQGQEPGYHALTVREIADRVGRSERQVRTAVWALEARNLAWVDMYGIAERPDGMPVAGLLVQEETRTPEEKEADRKRHADWEAGRQARREARERPPVLPPIPRCPTCGRPPW